MLQVSINLSMKLRHTCTRGPRSCAPPSFGSLAPPLVRWRHGYCRGWGMWAPWDSEGSTSGPRRCSVQLGLDVPRPGMGGCVSPWVWDRGCMARSGSRFREEGDVRIDSRRSGCQQGQDASKVCLTGVLKWSFFSSLPFSVAINQRKIECLAV